MIKEKKSFFILVGERSGEEHFLSFFSKLKSLCPEVDFWGIGGDDMAAQGVDLFTHFRDLSTMGFSGVVSKLKFYLDLKKSLVSEILKRNCQDVLLVDYQGLNYQLAKELKPLGVRVHYYVAPQVWAWKPWRAKVLAENCVNIFSILPFEKLWWKQRGLGDHLTTVNHPLLNSLKNKGQINSTRKSSDAISIVFLPGSRMSEVSHHLPIFEKMIRILKAQNYKIKTTCIFADHLPKSWSEAYCSIFDTCLGQSQLEEVLSESDLSVASSGTITLTLGIFQVPTIVCYRVSWINAFIYRAIVRYAGPASLTNIIHKKMIFPELLQESCEANNLVLKVKEWIDAPEKLELVRQELVTTRDKLLGEFTDPCEKIIDKMK
ncbi:MAG: hypothetical protein QE271_09530 [Bacteriovoracaceae bacterium]|nr:hypothetical protein [Bacteriovoracaceae bacterium]